VRRWSGSGAAEFRIVGLAADDFPVLPHFDKLQPVAVELAALRRLDGAGASFAGPVASPAIRLHARSNTGEAQPGQGTGLGLSICHTTVSSLGGTIEVNSSVGRGSSFQVRLPVPDPAPALLSIRG